MILPLSQHRDPCLQIPESPIWLIIRGDSAGAERSLCWLRGWTEPEVVRYEFQELVHYSRESGTCGDKDDVNLGSSSNLSLFKDPLIYKPFKIMIIYSFVAFIVSVTPARPFLSRILTEAGLPNHQNVYCVSKRTRHTLPGFDVHQRFIPGKRFVGGQEI